MNRSSSITWRGGRPWAAAAVWLAACSGASPAPTAPDAATVANSDHPDIVFVTIDTLRADRVGCYGDPLASTPTLDALAAEGLLFREAHAVAPLTLPSHATLLTGRAPSSHGLRDNGAMRLPDAVPTLAEALSAGGYRTGAFVSAYVLDAAWGLDRGFGLYRSPFHPQAVSRAGAFGEVELPAAEVVNAAVAWWSSHEASGAPRFLWLHLFDPHAPWAPGPGDPYRGDVSRADAHLRRVVDAVGPDTAIVVMADHGEGLWSEGERHHGMLLGRAITRVPLIIRPPGGLVGPLQAPEPRPGLPTLGQPAGLDPELLLEAVPDAPRAARVVGPTVSGLDVAATLAGLAGLPFATEGVDLSPFLQDPAPLALLAALAARPALAETQYPLLHLGVSPLWMAQDDVHRVVSGVWSRACRWVDDPACASAVDAPAALSAAIAAAQAIPAPVAGVLDPEVQSRLAALGYLTDAAPPPTGELADPRDAVAGLRALREAEGIDDPARRAEVLAAIIAAQPASADARLGLSLARVELGDLPGARQALAELLDRWPDHMMALNNAAALAHLMRDDDAALRDAGRMIALNPHDPRGYRIQVSVYVRREDKAAVVEVAERGLAVAPNDANLHYVLGVAQVQGGAPAAGAEHLKVAKLVGTEATDVELWLGLAYERAGDIDLAVRHYEAATRTMDGDLRPWGLAGLMLARADRCAEALPFLVNVSKRGGGVTEVRDALARCESARADERAAGRAAKRGAPAGR